MGLMNYTSQVPVNRSISYIEDKLARHGASQILKMYTIDGQVEGIAFIISLDGVDMPFKVPAKIVECEKILRESVKRPRKDTLKRIKQQAEKTAWKIVSDWVDVQMAMIDLAQVEFMQAFFPYLYSHSKQQTYFEIMKAKGLQKLLPELARE